jgi:hypothetical protein
MGDTNSGMKKLSYGVTGKVSAPKGWIIDNNATTAPKGHVWITNNQSRFSGKRQSRLARVNY